MALAVGLCVGLAAAWALAGLLEAFLFQIEPRAPGTFLAAGTVLIAAALAASALPAVRAARVDPAVTLR